jgi:UDP-N-acetylmuramoyl-tripeptide--D-alanyl-D-alanine ligase
MALEGSSSHGHDYLESARENGATASVVESPQSTNIPQFVVDDSTETLKQLGRIHRSRNEGTYRIGVTGTCGKTTVKNMLSRLLSDKYRTGSTPGNFNNELGLPLTLLNQGDGDVLVAEIGTNAPGEIATLSHWLKPDIGVITHVGAGHLEGLGTIEAVAEEKSDLFQALPDDGFAVIPDGIDYADRVTRKASCSVIRVKNGMNEPVSVHWTVGNRRSRLNYKQHEIDLSVSSEGLVIDAALAAVVAGVLGVDVDAIREGLESFEPLEGRGRVLSVRGTEIIDGSYNANPSSVRDALERFQGRPGPKLLVLGDMKELGSSASTQHRSIANTVNALENLDVVFVGENRHAFAEGLDVSRHDLRTAPTVEALDSISLDRYETTLVKASNSVGLGQLIDEWRDQS